MSKQLSYAPVVPFDLNGSDSANLAKAFASRLHEREIPACLLRRNPALSLSVVGNLSRELLSRGILPVVQLLPGDPHTSLRNLAESCILGFVDLVWQDGAALFDRAEAKAILLGAGRARIPVDIQLHFAGDVPPGDDFGGVAEDLKWLIKKYGHLQVIKLAEIPVATDDVGSRELSFDHFRKLLDMCQGSLAAVSPFLWTNNSSLRSGASDLGLTPIAVLEPSDGIPGSRELSGVMYIAGTLGLPVVPRLPLLPRYYKKGWFSFDVGKAFEAWTDRKPYRAYRELTGWLED